MSSLNKTKERHKTSKEEKKNNKRMLSSSFDSSRSNKTKQKNSIRWVIILVHAITVLIQYERVIFFCCFETRRKKNYRNLLMDLSSGLHVYIFVLLFFLFQILIWICEEEERRFYFFIAYFHNLNT